MTTNNNLIYYSNLIKRINSSMFEDGINEIIKGKKTSCWAWWAFPADYTGNELGVPENQKTKLDSYTFKMFIDNLPLNWINMANAIKMQISKGKVVTDIIPLIIDQIRIHKFIKFFNNQLKKYQGLHKNKLFVLEYVTILKENFNRCALKNIERKEDIKLDNSSIKNTLSKKKNLLLIPGIFGSYYLYTTYKKSRNKRRNQLL